MSVGIQVGTRFPAYATSMGRALIACGTESNLEEFVKTVDLHPLTEYTITDRETFHNELIRVRQRGWSLVDQELEEGLRSVAAPIRDARGQVVAAINVAAPARRDRSDAEAGSDFVVPLRQAAAAIEDDLLRTRLEF